MDVPRECDLYKVLDAERGVVECSCCNHRCSILAGRSGKCKIRYNVDGKLYLAVYGRPCALHVDPVEKKPLHHFLPGTRVYSVGTFGCNFKCSFCQNWDISQLPRQLTKGDACPSPEDRSAPLDVEELASRLAASSHSASPEKIVSSAVSERCRSIAFTYNEPTIWAEFSHDIGVLASARGLPCIYVTNGFMTAEHLAYMRPYVRALNVDLKSWSNMFYRRECGAPVEPVKETIRRAHEMGFWVEVTTLVIPGLNDSNEELGQIAQFLASVSPAIPWHLSAFHPDYQMRDRERTPLSTLERAYAIGRSAGLRFVYLGNVRCPERENTDCPKCGMTLVRRSGYQVEIDQGFREGRCPCGEPIEGVWK